MILLSAAVLLHLVSMATTEHMPSGAGGGGSAVHERDLRGVKKQGTSAAVSPLTDKFKRQVRVRLGRLRFVCLYLGKCVMCI